MVQFIFPTGKPFVYTLRCGFVVFGCFVMIERIPLYENGKLSEPVIVLNDMCEVRM